MTKELDFSDLIPDTAPQEGELSFDDLVPSQEPSLMGRVGQSLSNMASDVGTFFAGQHDPAFEGVGPITEMDIGDSRTEEGRQAIAAMSRAKAFAHDDARYHDTLKQLLGDRYIGTDKTKFGQQVINYRDLEGNPTRGHVNVPGLDWQDVDRTAAMALPYTIGGAVGGNLMRGAGMLGRAVGTGLGTTTASVGSDIAANTMGSEQDPATMGIDPARAVIAGGIGGLSQVVPLSALGVAGGGGLGLANSDFSDPVDVATRTTAGALTGGLGGAMLGRLLRGKSAADDIKADDLPPTARVAAKEANLDLGDLDQEGLKLFADNYDKVANVKELGAAIRNRRFGLLSSKGQRADDPTQLLIEKDARVGNLGEPAKQRMQQFDTAQRGSVQESALVRPESVPNTEPGIAQQLAPDATPSRLTPENLTRSQLGDDIQSGLQAVRQSDDEAINQAWQGIDRVYARQEAFPKLAQTVDEKLNFQALSDKSTPNALRAQKILKDMMEGKEAVRGSGLGDPSTRRMDLELVRRDLKQAYDDAYKGDPSDFRATKAFYHGFNDWVDGLVDEGMVAGDAANISKLRTARSLTSDMKGRWLEGDKTPAGRIIKKALDGDTTPEEMVSSLFTSPSSKNVKQGTVPALRKMKDALTRTGRDEETTRAGVRAWNDIRLAHWSSLVLDKRGQMATPRVIKSNIDNLFQNQGSTMNALYSPQERELIRSYSKALSDLVATDPNPPGTATALKALIQGEGAGMSTLKTFFQTQQKRELFSKNNVIMSRIYQMLAKNLPKRLGTTAEGLGERAAVRQTTQRPEMLPKGPRAPFLATISTAETEE